MVAAKCDQTASLCGFFKSRCSTWTTSRNTGIDNAREWSFLCFPSSAKFLKASCIWSKMRYVFFLTSYDFIWIIWRRYCVIRDRFWNWFISDCWLSPLDSSEGILRDCFSSSVAVFKGLWTVTVFLCICLFNSYLTVCYSNSICFIIRYYFRVNSSFFITDNEGFC